VKVKNVVEGDPLIQILIDESRRVESLIKEYKAEFSKLPKGSLHIRVINGGKYYFVKFREGKRSVYKHIKKGGEEEEVRRWMEVQRRRKALMEDIKKLEGRLKLIRRALWRKS
jgi:hypothetical protein